MPYRTYRSAYRPRFNPYKKMGYRKKSTKTTLRPRRGRYPKPTRFFNSRSTYRRTRMLTNTLRNISETHINPLKEFDQVSTHAMVGNSNGYYKGFCTGIGVVPTNLTNFVSLDGFNYPTDIRGNSVYHRKISNLFQIDMSPNQATTSITEFRVLVFSQKRNNSISLMDPELDLFLANDGNYFSWNTPPPVAPEVGATGPKLMVAKCNLQRYNILKDIRFTLSSPQILGSGTSTQQAYSGKYPTMKRFKMDVPIYRKITLDTNNHPADYNFTTCCVILSRTLQGEALANDWTISTMNGISTFTDM